MTNCLLTSGIQLWYQALQMSACTGNSPCNASPVEGQGSAQGSMRVPAGLLGSGEISALFVAFVSLLNLDTLSQKRSRQQIAGFAAITAAQPMPCRVQISLRNTALLLSAHRSRNRLVYMYASSKWMCPNNPISNVHSQLCKTALQEHRLDLLRCSNACVHMTCFYILCLTAVLQSELCSQM